MHRLINQVVFLLLLVVFILFSGVEARYFIILSAFLAFLTALLAFFLNWLSLDGITPAGLMGTITLGLGGWHGAAILLLFFIGSSLLSAPAKDGLRHQSERRDGNQVWANGFWFGLGILLWHMTDLHLFWWFAAGAVATATADTWATELGYHRFDSRAYLITTFKQVIPGTNGAVSLRGTISAVIGSFLIGLVVALLARHRYVDIVLSVGTGGFLGSLADSYLGAAFENQRVVISTYYSDDESFRFGNNLVNWCATGTGALCTVILMQIL